MQYPFVALFAFLAVSYATHGVDVSQAVSTSHFNCLKGAGYSFAIVRCYRSTGSVDPNCASTIHNAHSGGMAHVDAYMFPCHRCGNAAGQVKAMVDHLHSTGSKFGMIWFDIEGTQYWGSQSSNVAFMEELMKEAQRLGVNYGVYTSASQWGPIMGDWHGASSRPLWYAHYDNHASFSDFRPFGGWTKPAIKQYAGDATVCGVGVDKNFY